MTTSSDISKLIAHSLKCNPADQKRYWVAHLDDGRQINEHQCRWADVPIHQVIMLELNMLGNKYLMERRNLSYTFVEFVQFKTAIKRRLGDSLDETLSRCIGWHDGITEYIIRVDEKTGKRIGDIESYSPPRHLHPQSRLLFNG